MKKTILLLTFTLFIIVNLAYAESIYGCAYLNVSGEYTLESDILDSTEITCMSINATNVTLDCKGHRIDASTGKYGINITEKVFGIENITIKSCNISGWTTANIFIGSEAITSYTANNTRIINNSLTSSGRGIQMWFTEYNLIKNNYIYNNTYGVYDDFAGIKAYNNYTNNIFKSNKNDIYIHSEYLKINGNYFNETLDASIYFDGEGYSKVFNNTFYYNNKSIYFNQDGATQNNVSFNKITNATTAGIYLLEGVTNDMPIANWIYNNMLNNSQNIYYDFRYGGSCDTTNLNYWNTSITNGTRVFGLGDYVGGNYWAHPNRTGFSENCTDSNFDGICENQYNLSYEDVNADCEYDWWPLSNSTYPYTINFIPISLTEGQLSNYTLIVPRLPNATDLSNMNALLYLDSEAYSPTKSINQTNYIFSVNTRAYENPSYRGVWHYWTFNSTFTNSTIYILTTYSSFQPIEYPRIGLCSDGLYNYNLLNISFFDEDSLEILSSNLDITFEGFYQSNLFLALNTSHNFTNINDTAHCSDIEISNQYLITMTYTSEGYPIKIYDFLETLSTDNPSNLSLYLSNNGNLTDILVTLYDTSSKRLSDYFIKFERYYPASNTYYNVETIKTDNNGEASFHLIPLLKEYRILIYDYRGDLVKLIPRTTIKASTVSITLQTEENIMSDFKNLDEAMVSLTFDNETKEVVWQTQQANSFPLSCLQVVRLSDGGELLYDNCQSGQSVIDTYTITENTTEQHYQFKGYFKNTDGEIISSTIIEYMTFKTVKEIYGDTALVLTLIIVITMFMIGVYNPAIAVALAGLGVVISMWTGFLTLTFGSLIVFILMIGFLLYKFKT